MSTQNITFHWIVMKIKKFMLPIWWYNRDLFPLWNKYNVVFVFNGLTPSGNQNFILIKPVQCSLFLGFLPTCCYVRKLISFIYLHQGNKQVTKRLNYKTMKDRILSMFGQSWALLLANEKLCHGLKGKSSPESP